MNLSSIDHMHQGEPVHPGAPVFSTWLTVAEATSYCSLKGLNRTSKTIRKWALRSHNDSENADLKVRREDIETGFRWSIERDSLDRKIIQELEFEKRMRTSVNHSEVPEGAPVQTGAPISFQTEKKVREGAPGHPGSPEHEAEVKDGKDVTLPATNLAELIDSLRDQIRRLDEQVDFYKEELRDRRTSTKALAEVIQAFRLNAENQNTRQHSSGNHHDVRQPKKDVGDNEAGIPPDNRIY